MRKIFTFNRVFDGQMKIPPVLNAHGEIRLSYIYITVKLEKRLNYSHRIVIYKRTY